MFDLWTASNGEPYIAINVHLVDENWEAKTYLLDFIQVFGQHTGQNLADLVVSVLDDYDIAAKVRAQSNMYSRRARAPVPIDSRIKPEAPPAESQPQTPVTPITPAPQSRNSLPVYHNPISQLPGVSTRLLGYIATPINPAARQVALAARQRVVPVPPHLLVLALILDLAWALMAWGVGAPCARALVGTELQEQAAVIVSFVVLWLGRLLAASANRTPGQAILGLRVMKGDQPATPSQVFGRFLLMEFGNRILGDSFSLLGISWFFVLDVARTLLWGDSQTDILAGQRVVKA